MAPETSSKPKQKRQKKRKSRTEVSSDSSSDSEPASEAESKPKSKSTLEVKPNATTTTKLSKEEEVDKEFTAFYLQRVTTEFAEDLDKIRGADDFKGDALPILIEALKKGTSLFSEEEKRRVVNAGKPTA